MRKAIYLHCTGNPELDRKLIAEDYDILFPTMEAAVASGEEQRFTVWLGMRQIAAGQGCRRPTTEVINQPKIPGEPT